MSNTKDTENLDKQIKEAFAGLSDNQIRFVVAMQEYRTKKEAAEAIGLNPQTVYRWPPEVDEATRLAREAAVDSALEMLGNRLLKAVAIKLSGLESDDERIRQSVSTEVMDLFISRAAKRMELTGLDGGPIKTYTVVSPDDWPE